MEEIRPGRYRHFKGGEYEVVGLATHSETMEPMVVYRALYGARGLWVRPAAMWKESVTRDGKTAPRFTYLGQADPAPVPGTAEESFSRCGGQAPAAGKGALMRIALIQMKGSADKAECIGRAVARLGEARAAGAELAVLPEMFCCPYDNACFRAYGEPHGGPAQRALSAAAADLGLLVVGGSLPELADGRVYNTSYVYGPDGAELARHRKVHLFDIDVEGGQHFRESDTLSPGGEITTFDTAFGTMGLCICFDLRFEELSRCMALRGARVLIVPAAFNMTTGPAHWELLFRQRAVDNQCFVLGCSPARDETASYVAYGNSLAVDPWGTVLCRAGGEETVLYADLDLSRVDAVRRQLPILSARRTDLYELREK